MCGAAGGIASLLRVFMDSSVLLCDSITAIRVLGPLERLYLGVGRKPLRDGESLRPDGAPLLCLRFPGAPPVRARAPPGGGRAEREIFARGRRAHALLRARQWFMDSWG